MEDTCWRLSHSLRGQRSGEASLGIFHGTSARRVSVRLEELVQNLPSCASFVSVLVFTLQILSIIWCVEMKILSLLLALLIFTPCARAHPGHDGDDERDGTSGQTA